MTEDVFIEEIIRIYITGETEFKLCYIADPLHFYYIGKKEENKND